MLKGFTPEKIYLATGYTDLRKGIDGLAGIVQEQFQLDAFSDALFLFCGRHSDRIKGLYWDSNGFTVQAVGERQLPLAQNDAGSYTDHRKAV